MRFSDRIEVIADVECILLNDLIVLNVGLWLWGTPSLRQSQRVSFLLVMTKSSSLASFFEEALHFCLTHLETLFWIQAGEVPKF